MLTLLALTQAVAVATASLVVQTEFGKVEGAKRVVDGVNLNTWLGVPFGADPVGNLRWKPVDNVT